jgi:hypothetical protein
MLGAETRKAELGRPLSAPGVRLRRAAGEQENQAQ